MSDPFEDVRNKRMGELNSEQTYRAIELWLREKIGPSETFWYPLLQALFRVIDALRADAARLTAENANLRTVMVAAAEEIQAHWDAHCDAEGYGPANLMHRLEEGVPAEYGYTAGAFARLTAERDALREAGRLILAWFDADSDHAGTTFWEGIWERIEMCQAAEDALQQPKEPSNG